MLISVNDLRGVVVEGTDGAIGRIDDLFFDDQSWTVRFLRVETGAWLEGRKVLISPLAVGASDPARRLLSASLTREQVRNSPEVDSHKPVSRQHEVEQYAYYGYPYYWGGSGLWGEGLQTRSMLAALGDDRSPEAARLEADFVQKQAAEHRERGDDPHLRSARAMIRYHIHATDGEIGHVDALIVDDATWTIRYFVLNTSDWWLGHQVLVSPRWIVDISWLDATVSVDVSRDAVKHAPAFDPDALPDRDQEERLHRHHGRPDDGTETAKPTGEPVPQAIARP